LASRLPALPNISGRLKGTVVLEYGLGSKQAVGAIDEGSRVRAGIREQQKSGFCSRREVQII
jgi:hypothetical protein